MAVMEAKEIRKGGPQIKTALPGPNAKRVVQEDARIISPRFAVSR